MTLRQDRSWCVTISSCCKPCDSYITFVVFNSISYAVQYSYCKSEIDLNIFIAIDVHVFVGSRGLRLCMVHNLLVPGTVRTLYSAVRDGCSYAIQHVLWLCVYHDKIDFRDVTISRCLYRMEGIFADLSRITCIEVTLYGIP